MTTTAPTGPARVYTDALGRTQYAVDGPKGAFLVTRPDQHANWNVWRSDSLRTVAQARQLGRAIALASKLCGYANKGDHGE